MYVPVGPLGTGRVLQNGDGTAACVLGDSRCSAGWGTALYASVRTAAESQSPIPMDVERGMCTLRVDKPLDQSKGSSMEGDPAGRAFTRHAREGSPRRCGWKLLIPGSGEPRSLDTLGFLSFWKAENWPRELRLYLLPGYKAPFLRALWTGALSRAGAWGAAADHEGTGTPHSQTSVSTRPSGGSYELGLPQASLTAPGQMGDLSGPRALHLQHGNGTAACFPGGWGAQWGGGEPCI